MNTIRAIIIITLFLNIFIGCEHIVEEDLINMQEVMLKNPYPNPCYDSVVIEFFIPQLDSIRPSMNATLDIETIAGDIVANAIPSTQYTTWPNGPDTIQVTWKTLRDDSGNPIETAYMAHLYTSTGVSKRKYFVVEK